MALELHVGLLDHCGVLQVAVFFGGAVVLQTSHQLCVVIHPVGFEHL